VTLKPAKYKSPSGQVVPFDYEDIESNVDTKAAVFETALGNGTYVQPNGHTSGRFPMACFFSGENYEDKAEAFLSAVLETGEGILSHPIHSDINVVPVGTVVRADNLVTAGNQVVYTLTFFETTGLQIGEQRGLKQIFDSLIRASSVDFSQKVQIENDPVDNGAFRARLESTLNVMRKRLKDASGAVAKVSNAIEDTGDSINRGLDTLIGEPLTLARQIQMLIGEPRRQNNAVQAKIDGYLDLAADIFQASLAEPGKYSRDSANNFHFNKMRAQAIVANTAMVISDSTEFLTRSQYIAASDTLSALLEAYQTWNDNNFESLETAYIDPSNIDTGDGISELYELIYSVCSDMITKSFNAKIEYREQLASDRTPIDLCYELYGTNSKETMDLFLASNGITGDEHFLIPKGREIVAYL
jgi:prophage DNA circulation protein